MKPKVCFADERLDVSLMQHGKDNFSVRYGLQFKEGLSYAEAAAELGACVLHALACAGRLDNRERGEK